MATGFAAQAALALQLADTHARARGSARLLAIMNDRDRISRDLHDLVIQRLYAAGLGLHSLARRYIPTPRDTVPYRPGRATRPGHPRPAHHDLRPAPR